MTNFEALNAIQNRSLTSSHLNKTRNNCHIGLAISQRSKQLFTLCVLMAMSGLTVADNQTTDSGDDLTGLSPKERAFLEDDSFFETMNVQDSPLKWVTQQKTKGSYSLFNEITILPSSLEDGFVKFTQCHRNLDEIRAIDIVYNPKTTQALEVVSARGVGQYQTQAEKVELYQVEKGAEVCIQGQNKTLIKATQTQTWQLDRGPYMRKFLDGYYPMSVEETIFWPARMLSWQATRVYDESQKTYQLISQPATTSRIAENSNRKTATHRPQISHQADAGKLASDYWFEGALRVRYQFQGIQNAPSLN